MKGPTPTTAAGFGTVDITIFTYVLPVKPNNGLSRVTVLGGLTVQVGFALQAHVLVIAVHVPSKVI